jgi:hypothetical protein
MLSDVYRSRYGFLATPPVPAVIVADGHRESSDLGGPLEERVGKVVADSLDGVPVPLVVRGSTVTVLLPLVEPVGVATVFSALRAEFTAHDVSRRSLNLDGLAGLGTLAGRLRAATEPPGVE